jgi:D-alanyl-D-alanine carboxypeptidase
VVERLRAHAEARIAAGDTPGVALAVTATDGSETVLTAGHADLRGTPLRPGHLLQIGSISKSFAAICALQLEAEGALALDDRLVDHLPWFRVSGGHGPITLRHLLMHRSGLPMGADPGPSSLGLVAELAAAETEWEPGTRFWYSNIGYDALGFALETVAGVPFPELVRRRVFEPLGMHESRAHITEADRGRLADGHDGRYPDRPWHPGSGLATAPFAPSEGASGSIVSTAGDMAGYIRHLLARGPAGFDRMIDGVPDDEGEPYGLGLRISQRKGHTVVGHSGGMVGYVAQMLCDMKSGVGTIALSNGPSGARTVAEYALDLARAEAERAPFPDPPADEADDLGDAAGRYGPITVDGAGIHAFGRDGDLRRSDEDDLYKTDHPDLCTFYVRFGRGDGGRVDHLMCGDAWYPGEGYSGPVQFPHPAEWATYPGLYRSHNPWLPAVRITLSRGELAMEQSSYGRMPLEPHPDGGFALSTPEGRLPERLRFSTMVDGLAQRVETGGCVLYRAARS